MKKYLVILLQNSAPERSPFRRSGSAVISHKSGSAVPFIQERQPILLSSASLFWVNYCKTCIKTQIKRVWLTGSTRKALLVYRTVYIFLSKNIKLDSKLHSLVTTFLIYSLVNLSINVPLFLKFQLFASLWIIHPTTIGC